MWVRFPGLRSTVSLQRADHLNHTSGLAPVLYLPHDKIDSSSDEPNGSNTVLSAQRAGCLHQKSCVLQYDIHLFVTSTENANAAAPGRKILSTQCRHRARQLTSQSASKSSQSRCSPTRLKSADSGTLQRGDVCQPRLHGIGARQSRERTYRAFVWS